MFSHRAPTTLLADVKVGKAQAKTKGCSCADDKYVSSVLKEIGMPLAAGMHAKNKSNWTPEEWTQHAKEEDSKLFPLFRVIAGQLLVESERVHLRNVVSELENDHKVFVYPYTDKNLNPPEKEMLIHGQREDKLIKKYAKELKYFYSKINKDATVNTGANIIELAGYKSSTSEEVTASIVAGAVVGGVALLVAGPAVALTLALLPVIGVAGYNIVQKKNEVLTLTNIFNLDTGKMLGDGEVVSQLKACELISNKRKDIPRNNQVNFIVDFYGQVTDKIPDSIMKHDETFARKQQMEKDYYSAIKYIFPVYGSLMEKWGKAMRDVFAFFGMKSEPDARYDSKWADQYNIDVQRMFDLGVPAFRGIQPLGEPESEWKKQVPQWVAENLRYQLREFLNLSAEDQSILRDFWIRCVKRRNYEAKVLFAGVGSNKECPQDQCSEYVDLTDDSVDGHIRRGCVIFEWENCDISLSPINDPQSMTYNIASVYAATYSTDITQARKAAMREEFFRYGTKDGLMNLRKLNPGKEEEYYKDSTRELGYLTTAPYNLPIQTFVELCKISRDAAKKSEFRLTHLVKLAPLAAG